MLSAIDIHFDFFMACSKSFLFTVTLSPQVFWLNCQFNYCR